jgi:epoxyqueuosine reductase
MELDTFIKDKSIQEYAVMDIESINAPNGFHPIDILPTSKRLILLIKIIPEYIFNIKTKTKSFQLYELIREMDRISYGLSVQLSNEGYKSVSIPCFFPIKVEKGKLRGYISFKHLAEQAGIGSLGLNTLLISKKYGNRVCLTAVITEKELDLLAHEAVDLCLKCNKCINSCPSTAIDGNGVKVTKCINFSSPIPRIFRPFVKPLMSNNRTKKYMEIIINTLSWNIDMLCSECMINCPYFSKSIDCHRD